MNTNKTIPEPCPTIDELRAHLEDAREELETHLEHCRRCRALLRLFAEEPHTTTSATRRLATDASETPDGTTVEPVDGTEQAIDRLSIGEGSLVVAASPEAPGELVLAIVLDASSEAASFGSLVVAPLSAEIRFATEWDLILRPDETPLDYSVIAELWNHGTLLRDQLEEHRGRVTGEAWERLDALYELVLRGEESADGRQLDGRGVAVVDDADPRLLFQDEESERAGAFWMPAARALELESEEAAGHQEIAEAEEPLTVGAILREWLEEQGYDADEYARTIGFEPRDVDAVCTDRIDPLVFSQDRLAAVIRRPQRDMAIDEDDLVAALGRSFIPDADWELVGAYGSERAYGRTAGLRGSKRADALRKRQPSSQPLSHEEKERRKKAYVSEVIAALEEAGTT